ncbi:MAG: hypothetical protein ACFCGT_14590 [Sandaracinaceae bacterium]
MSLVALPLAACITAEGEVARRRPEPVVAISIEPRDTEIVTFGEPVTRAFRLVGTRGDGTESPIAADEWRVDERFGAFDDGGRLTVHGLRAGEVEVRARLDGDSGEPLTASTLVTVRSLWEVFESVAPETVDAALAAPLERGGPALLHPLDGAVVPDDLPQLELRWEAGGAGQVDLIRIGKEHVEVLLALAGASRDLGAYDLAGAPALALLESDPDTPLKVEVERFEDEVRRAGPTHAVEVVPGPFLADPVYFEDTGRILTLAWPTARLSELLPSPPRREGDDCVGCHVASRDGEALALSLYEDPSTGFLAQLDDDLSRFPAPGTLLTGSGEDFTFADFGPDGELLIGVVDSVLVAFDREDGAARPDLALPGGVATHPAFGPDGDRLLFIRPVDGTPVDFVGGDLWEASRDDAGFVDARRLHVGADLADEPEGGATDSHPTFGPDPSWIAFAHGPGSTLGRDEATPSAAYLARGEPPTLVRLASLRPEGIDSVGWPVFVPRVSGDGARRRYWIAFLSRAPFGNGTSGTRGSGRRQLWLSALDPEVPDDQDPSAVPVRIPGQDPRSENLGVAFLRRGCLDPEEPCSGSRQCCEGLCRARDAADDDEIVLVCR